MSKTACAWVFQPLALLTGPGHVHTGEYVAGELWGHSHVCGVLVDAPAAAGLSCILEPEPSESSSRNRLSAACMSPSGHGVTGGGAVTRYSLSCLVSAR